MKDKLEVLAAIEVVRNHLEKEWLVPTCEDEPMLGCASCHAQLLDQQLQMLQNSLIED